MQSQPVARLRRGRGGDKRVVRDAQRRPTSGILVEDLTGAGDINFRPFQAEIFTELDAYIRELRQSGFDTVRLQVQLQKKFSVPLFALIMALISAPFAFLTGSRGAMAGVGVSFGIAIAYWALGQLFEQIGNINQLPAALAAWSPDAIFCLAGVYLMARMRT